jgi:chorismate mutase
MLIMQGNLFMTEKRLYGIRGATVVENTASSIYEQVERMCSSLFRENGIQAEDIVSIQFTVTQDLDALNPATALRRSDCRMDISSCALFCAAEPFVKGGLQHVIRILVTAYLEQGAIPKHIFQNGAEILRPDLGLEK